MIKRRLKGNRENNMAVILHVILHVMYNVENQWINHEPFPENCMTKTSDISFGQPTWSPFSGDNY